MFDDIIGNSGLFPEPPKPKITDDDETLDAMKKSISKTLGTTNWKFEDDADDEDVSCGNCKGCKP